ncbi:hypothetical protein GIB67_027988 [Kingdonia uniflora]|uniref:Uncharacterized protein n=1 Tax=Kingdonia uniflora TaxID=39325 RepID=A0A7J7L2F3_9MAGN|nr:hypothetical protein GIB67_027988 [Kingdonia uniflora]
MLNLVGGSTTATHCGRGTSATTTQSRRGASASTTTTRSESGGVNNTSATRGGRSSTAPSGRGTTTTQAGRGVNNVGPSARTANTVKGRGKAPFQPPRSTATNSYISLKDHRLVGYKSLQKLIKLRHGSLDDGLRTKLI